MSKYIIKYNKKHEIETKGPISCVDKTGISYCLSDGCELTERIGNRDIYLGLINYKTMIYFSIEFTKFGMKNCSNNHENQKYYNDYFFGIDSLMDGLIYWCLDKGTLDVSFLDDPGSYHCEDYVDFELCIQRSILENLRYINGIFGIFPHLAEEEMVKRVKVAIDYLKSGKHLFRS